PFIPGFGCNLFRPVMQLLFFLHRILLFFGFQTLKIQQKSLPLQEVYQVEKTKTKQTKLKITLYEETIRKTRILPFPAGSSPRSGTDHE
uniref:hypothetical protein n=1 Tax=Phocaeicola coprophilus TaxID=387090 RepID=UPI0040257EF9